MARVALVTECVVESLRARGRLDFPRFRRVHRVTERPSREVSDLADVDTLQAMIRNECVNDGSRESGEEVRNADVLERFLVGPGLDVERDDDVLGAVDGLRRREAGPVPGIRRPAPENRSLSAACPRPRTHPRRSAGNGS